MKIAALTPQFVIESPPGETQNEIEKTVSDLKQAKFKVVPPTEGAAESGDSVGGRRGPSPLSELNDEAKQGFKRLSKLMLAHKKELAQKLRFKRATSLYLRIAKGGDPRDDLGKNIDRSA